MRFLPRPYRDLRTLGAREEKRFPRVGDILAVYDRRTHDRWALRVIDIRDAPINTRGIERAWHLRPPHLDPDPLTAHDDDRHLGWAKPPWLELLDEDFPVSRITGGLMPTRETAEAWEREDSELERIRFSTAGICPACGEPVTRRQHSVTFTANLVNPDGPDVTFHVREKCWTIGGAYQTELKQHDREVDRFLAYLEGPQ